MQALTASACVLCNAELGRLIVKEATNFLPNP